MKPTPYLLILIFVFYSFFGFSQGYVTSQQKQNFKNEVKFDMPPSAPNATKPFDLVNLQLLNQTIQNAIINSGSGTVNFVGITTPAGLNVSIPQITTTGTFNITFANGYSIPTNAMQANWNTAYSWGNPAGLYKPISYVPIWSEITSNPFLFSSPLDNQILKYSTSSGKWLNWTPTFEPGISGGTILQYWRGDKTWQTLPTSLPASDVYAWAKASIKPTYTYSEVGAAPISTVSFPGFGTTNVLAAAGNDSRILNGQTAFEWGNHASAGYVTGTPWTDMGYITGITSGNVTSALGFTPYNATNPAGYTSNLGTVTSVGSGLGLTGTVITSGTLALDTANVTVLSRQRASNTYQLKGNYVSGTPWTSMGYLTSISNGNVTTALGFTPYNSTNPNGYNTGTVTSITKGLGMVAGTISTTGSVALDTTDVTVLSRQRAANTYQVKLISASNIKTINGTTILGSGDITTSGSMVYPGVGIPLSTGSAWGTSITNNSANWNTAYTNTLHWDGSSTGLTAATGRTSLGLGTAAQNATGDFAPVAHVGSSGASHAAVTTSVNGFMIAADKSKLDGIAAGATANVGTVTSTSVASANGFAGTVVTATTTPAITISTSITGLLKGNGTAIFAASAGTDYLTPSGSAASLTSFPTFNQNTTGYAANLSGGAGGQILYQSASNTTSKVGNGTAGQILQSQGTTLAPTWVDNTGSGANAAGTYIVKTATNAPANAQILASLSTGLVKNTTTTGVLSIAVPRTDYLAPSDTLPISNYINGANTLASGKIAVLRGDSSVVTLSGGTTGQAVVKQADGTVAFATVGGGNSSLYSILASSTNTSSATLVPLSGISLTLAANSTYEIEFVLAVSISAVTTGAGFGLYYNGGAGATLGGTMSGSVTSTSAKYVNVDTFNLSYAGWLTTSGQTGGIYYKGIVSTGTTSQPLTIVYLKTTSGTISVYPPSYLKATLIP